MNRVMRLKLIGILIVPTLLTACQNDVEVAIEDEDFGAVGEETDVDSATETDTDTTTQTETAAFFDMCWATVTSANNHWQILDMVSYPDGALLVTGVFHNASGDIVFGADGASETAIPARDQSGFIARYGADGSLDWVVPAEEWTNWINVAPGGEAIATVNVPSENSMKLIRFDVDGNNVWELSGDLRVRDEGENYSSESYGGIVAGVVSDGLVVVGTFNGIKTFAAGTDFATTLDSGGPDTAGTYVAKYNLEGKFEWARSMADPLIPRSVDVDERGNLFIVADPLDPSFVDNEVAGLELARLNTEGVETWRRTIMIKNWDMGGIDSFDSIPKPSAQADGSVILGGLFHGSIVLRDAETEAVLSGPTTWVEGEANLSYSMLGVFFVASYSSEGALRWVNYPKNQDMGNAASASAFSTDPAGGLVLTGAVAGSVVFGAGDPNETTLSDVLFVARYNGDGTLDFARQISTISEYVETSAVAANTDGSILLAGSASGDVSAHLSSGETVELSSSDQNSFFLMRTCASDL